MRTGKRIVTSSFIVLAIAAVSACGDESTDQGEESGGSGGSGAAGGDAGPSSGDATGASGGASRTPAVAFPAAFTSNVVARGAGGAADLACVGSAKAPVGGEPIDVALRFVDSTNPTEALGGRRVSIYPRDGVFPGSCPDFYCTDTTTDSEGLATVSVPRGAWYGFEVPGDDVVVRSFQNHTLAPASADAPPVESIVTTRVGLQHLATLARLPRASGASFVAGRVHDCAGEPLENVLISAVSPDGERLQPRPGDPDDGARGTVYFAGDAAPMPDPQLAGTGENGRFAVGGVVAAPGLPYRIEAWAVTEPGAAPQRIACEAGEVLDDTITIVGLHPLRDDYELDHPCRFP